MRLMLAVCLASFSTVGLSQSGAPPTVSIVIRGETNLRASLVEALRSEANSAGLDLRVVDWRTPHDYTVILAQETSMAGAAAAVIALDADQEVVASVVRSGRLSGKGAMNACAKELVKRLVALRR